MSYRIVAKPRAWWPVVLTGANEDGDIVEQQLDMRFFVHKVDEAIELMTTTSEIVGKAQEAHQAGDTVAASAMFAEAVRLLACDWRGVELENGEAIHWSDANLRLLMNEPNMFEAVQAAYRNCVAGRDKIRAGN